MNKKVILIITLIFALGIGFRSFAFEKRVLSVSVVKPVFKSIPAKNIKVVRKDIISLKDKLQEVYKVRRQKVQNQRKVGFPLIKKQPFNFWFNNFGFNFDIFQGFRKKKAAEGILGESVKGEKYAIVIGVSNYPGVDFDLKYADDDARAVVNILETEYNFKKENIFYFIDEGNGLNENIPTQAAAQDIFDKIIYLKSIVQPDDEVVFFFSGHGAKGRADDGDRELIDEAILVHDGQNNLVYIWDGQLKQWFSDFSTDRIIFIFDSCLSGGMNDLASFGRIINMATQEFGRFDKAVEVDELSHGEFTYYFFVKGIKNKEGDTTPVDGLVSDEEAFDFANENCQSDRPTIIDKFENDLVF